MPSYDPDPFAYLMRQSTRRGGRGDAPVISNYADGSTISLTRASQKTDLLVTSPPGYAYQTFANNVPAVLSTGELLLENTAATQVLANPAVPADQVVTVTAASHRMWINAESGATMTITPGTSVITKSGVVQSSVTVTHGNPDAFSCTAGTVNITFSGTVYAAQLETGFGNPSSFIPFTGTRAAETATIIGIPAALMNNVYGTAIINVRQLYVTPNFSKILGFGNGGISKNAYDGGFYSNQTNGSGTLTATCGTGTLYDAKLAIAWDATSRKICGNGGAVNSGALLKAIATTTFTLGGDGFMGIIGPLTIEPRVYTNAELRAATQRVVPRAVMWGNSIVARDDGRIPTPSNGSGLSIPRLVTDATGYVVLNGGVEGETTTALLARYQANVDLWDKPLILGPGFYYNDLFTPIGTFPQSLTLSNIASLIALNTSGRVLVCGGYPGIRQSGANDERSGQTWNTRCANLDVALAATYGTNFLDYTPLMIAGATSNPADQLYASQGQEPWTFSLASTLSRVLSSAINSSTTTIPVNSSMGVNGDLIQIDSEVMQITSGGGTTSLTVVRGYGTGGVAAAHASGTPILTRPQTESPHKSWDVGRPFDAQVIAAKLRAMGWA